MLRRFTLVALLVTATPVLGQVPMDAVTEPTATRSYGDLHPFQSGDLRLPDGPGPFPLAILVHGGCWVDRLGDGTLSPMASALPESGIATWEIRYRRLGHEGGGWPGSFLDVGQGVDLVRELAQDFPLDLDRVVVVGHSSGAQLAAWVAGRPHLPGDSEIRGDDPLRVTAAVGVDGPMDLIAWSESGTDQMVCGQPVITALVGGTPEEQPERYAQASPAQMPPMEAALYLTPAQMMIQLGDPDVMTRRADSTGEEVHVVRVPESDHFQLLVPGLEQFEPVLATIRRALGMS